MKKPTKAEKERQGLSNFKFSKAAGGGTHGAKSAVPKERPKLADGKPRGKGKRQGQ
nr:hypothetical protein [uncultured Rhodopila sp.]